VVAEETPARIAARARLVRRVRVARAAPPPVGHPVRRFRAVCAYDGAMFAGWQRQRAHVGAQEIFEVALEEATGLPVQILASGRTDSGVHADGQVFSFDSATGLPPKAILHLCAHILPPEAVVSVVEVAPDGFHPQKDVVAKTYRYTVRTAAAASPSAERTAWRFGRPLDAARMAAAGALLLGTHDFRAFRTDPGPARRGEDTVRRIDAIRVSEGFGEVRIEVVGPGFMYMMVRNIAAVLASVGAGDQRPEWVTDILSGRDRRKLPPPAPAAGLCLVRVEYEAGWPLPGTGDARPVRLRRRLRRRRLNR
jgi:tRNA pseudouridine38-40 synthase